MLRIWRACSRAGEHTNRSAHSPRSTPWHVIAPDPRCPRQVSLRSPPEALQQESHRLPPPDPKTERGSSTHSSPPLTTNQLQPKSPRSEDVLYPSHNRYAASCRRPLTLHPNPCHHARPKAHAPAPSSRRWFARKRIPDQSRQLSPPTNLSGRRSMSAETNTQNARFLSSNRGPATQPHFVQQRGMAGGFCRCALSVRARGSKMPSVARRPGDSG